MAFLLKLTQQSLTGDRAVVPQMKSSRLSEADLGKQVYIWLDDQPGQKSALRGVATLLGMDEIEIPQVRDPSKGKAAYRLHLGDLCTDVRSPLTMDDLEPYRYSKGDGGLDRLGRIHRDRNDKIIVISSQEEQVLAARLGR